VAEDVEYLGGVFGSDGGVEEDQVEKIGGEEHSNRLHRIDALAQLAALGGPLHNRQEVVQPRLPEVGSDF